MHKIDRRILFTVLGLVFSGIFIFLSAALTYLKQPDTFFKIFYLQVAAILLGFLFIYIIQKNKHINYLSIKNNSFYLFIFGLVTQLLVLVPGVGVNLNGADRWINLGFMTVQPSEFFRFTFILFMANIFFLFSDKLKSFWSFLKISFPIAALLGLFYYFTRDLGSFVILVISIFAMLLFTQISKIKLIGLSFSAAIVLLGGAWFFSAHAHQRLSDFVYPEKADIQGSFYQNYNMMKAVGSGQLHGVGYGESLQKFNESIPEAISDSIFSVYAEEWGFLGSTSLVLILFFLTYSLFIRARDIKNKYQKYVVVGLSMNLIFPAFYNIAASMALVPLSGMPLTFISKGGTSILFALISVGIILLFIKK